MKTKIISTLLLAVLFSINTNAQVDIYRSGGGEIIWSGADVTLNDVDVNTNVRFTLFFHVQQLLNIDLNNYIGIYTGGAIRNVGLIMEDKFQYLGFTGVDENHLNYDVTAKVKRRSYSLGFPLALKLGSLDKDFFLYGGGEYEWMFAYKQKLFMDDNKVKYTEWFSDRVNSWIPSLFVGVQFPYGMNLKFKYYMKDFLNTEFTGTDFGNPVDYSQFTSTGMWYVSLSLILNKRQMQKMMESTPFEKSASL
jgi:hypothetical protein